MSVLLAGLHAEVTSATIERLVAQGDEVRVLDPDRGAEERWKAAGAYVACGPYDDDDLFERAAMGCRSVVLGPGAIPDIDSIITGLRRTDSQPRIIMCTPAAVEVATPAGWEAVSLVLGRSKILKRARVSTPAEVALAIDAADDIAAIPAGLVDLTQPSGWRALELEPPA